MIMKKQDYQKPTINVVQLQHRTMLLQASQAITNLDYDDDFDIEDTPAGTGFWGR